MELYTGDIWELSVKCVQPTTCGFHVTEDSHECVVQQRSHKPTQNIRDVFEILLVTTPWWFLSINVKGDNIVSVSKVRYTYRYLNVQCSPWAHVVEHQHWSQLLMHLGKIVGLFWKGRN